MPAELTEEERLFVAQFGIRLHNRRVELGLSKIDLVRAYAGDIPYEAARIQSKRIERMEDARNCTSVVHVIKLAKALKTTVAYLVGETNNPNDLDLNKSKLPIAKY